MRSITVRITFLGLFAILLCSVFLNISCNQTIYCPGCKLTPDEESFVYYTQNSKLIFKNDITNIFDTLSVSAVGKSASNCSDPCEKGASSAYSKFSFFHLSQGSVGINAGNTPLIYFWTGMPPIIYSTPIFYFQLNVPTQTITVNNIIYNDVFRVQTDSIAIDSTGDRLKVPWKLEYSKSSGFIRFYMLNGETWSKQ